MDGVIFLRRIVPLNFQGRIFAYCSLREAVLKNKYTAAKWH